MLIIAVWAILGAVGGGWAYSNALHTFPARTNEEIRGALGWASFISMLGPAAFVVGLFSSGFGQYGCWKSYYHPSFTGKK